LQDVVAAVRGDHGDDLRVLAATVPDLAARVRACCDRNAFLSTRNAAPAPPVHAVHTAAGAVWLWYDGPPIDWAAAARAASRTTVPPRKAAFGRGRRFDIITTYYSAIEKGMRIKEAQGPSEPLFMPPCKPSAPLNAPLPAPEEQRREETREQAKRLQALLRWPSLEALCRDVPPGTLICHKFLLGDVAQYYVGKVLHRAAAHGPYQLFSPALLFFSSPRATHVSGLEPRQAQR